MSPNPNRGTHPLVTATLALVIVAITAGGIWGVVASSYVPFLIALIGGIGLLMLAGVVADILRPRRDTPPGTLKPWD